MPVNKKDEKLLYDALLGKKDVLGELNRIDEKSKQPAEALWEYCASQPDRHHVHIALVIHKRSIFSKTRYVKLNDPNMVRLMLLNNTKNVKFGKFIESRNVFTEGLIRRIEQGFAKKIGGITSSQNKKIKEYLKPFSALSQELEPLGTWSITTGKRLMQDIETFKEKCARGEITESELHEISGFLLQKENTLPPETKAKITSVFGTHLEKALSKKQKQKFISETIKHYNTIRSAPAKRSVAPAASVTAERKSTAEPHQPRAAVVVPLPKVAALREPEAHPLKSFRPLLRSAKRSTEHTKQEREPLTASLKGQKTAGLTQQYEKDRATRVTQESPITPQEKQENSAQAFLDKYSIDKVKEKIEAGRKQPTQTSIASFFGHPHQDKSSQENQLKKLEEAFNIFSEQPGREGAQHLKRVLFDIIEDIKKEEQPSGFKGSHRGNSVLEKVATDMLHSLTEIFPGPVISQRKK